jgi:integrase/recombinase XerD
MRRPFRVPRPVRRWRSGRRRRRAPGRSCRTRRRWPGTAPGCLLGRLLDVDDLDLRLDDEHARIHGKGGTVRTVLLDDRGYVALLRLYLARAGYAHGPLFRASINGSGGPLSYDAAHHRWRAYCTAAGVSIGIHQLRHAHATELINSGVSIEAVRRRLGHASTETTQIYTLLADKIADEEIRAARRRRDTRR